MALMRGKEVPKDAVVLDEDEAISYAWDFVSNWETPSDTWALRHGPFILGGINAISGIIINNHYRKKLKLGPYGFLASAIPISVLPGLMTPLYHRHLISSKLLLMKDDACPICYEVRSAAIQLGFGLAYPMLLGPTAGLMLAHRYATARIPDLGAGPKVVFQFLRNLTRPFTGTLAYLASFQIIASAVITYFEMRNDLTLKMKVLEIEKKIGLQEESGLEF